MANMDRLRGLRALLEQVVEHGTTAVERVHMATAARPFDILAHIPPVAPGARGVRLVHDATVAGVYETIRQVNRLVGATLAVAIDVAEQVAEAEPPGAAEERGPEPVASAANDGENAGDAEQLSDAVRHGDGGPA
jgi:hypothetical protein